METITLTKVNVLKAYKNATKDQKKFLADLVGEFNVSGNIMDRIKNFKDACNELNLTSTVIPMIQTGFEKNVVAYQQLMIIVKALNEGWEPNWENTNEYKWAPWFNMKGGFGFSVSRYAITLSHSYIGSRLCFKSEELANYAGKQFEAIYKDFLTL